MISEVFETVIARMIEGLMFHDEMADYFLFLGLPNLSDIQRNMYMSESEKMGKIKRYYIERYNLLSPQIKVDFEPFLKHTDTLRNEIDVEEKKEAVKSCTEKWVAWERETKEVYEKAYTTLVEYKEIASAYKIIMLINDVSEEYDRANDLCLALKNTDYDMGFLMEVEDA